MNFILLISQEYELNDYEVYYIRNTINLSFLKTMTPAVNSLMSSSAKQTGNRGMGFMRPSRDFILCTCTAISRVFSNFLRPKLPTHTQMPAFVDWKRENGAYFLKYSQGVPVVAQQLPNPTRAHENAGSIPCLAQWVKDLVLP